MSSTGDERTLVLLRHAKAEQVPYTHPKPDHDRVLTDRGRRDAYAAGEWLHAQGIVAELVICSTSMRTRETWDHAAQGGAHTEFVEYRRAVYTGGADEILQAIQEDAGQVRTLIVVGHGPSIPDLASSLADGSGSPEAHQALGEGYPTCGLAVLRYDGEWADLGYGQASLDRFHVCRG